MAPTSELFGQLGISLLLGLLVGLQRERAAPGMFGLRTFPLITVFGTVCAILSQSLGGWIVVGGLLALVTVLAIAMLLQSKLQEARSGTTTDVAVLLMYLVGVLLVLGPMPVAIVVGGGVAVLLQYKPELHGLAARLGDADLRAIMQFVLITCIILPVLPNQAYGPLGVLNPRETWLIVVFIVGLSLTGYIIYKLFGRNAGILLGGLLGGAISSTATTVSYARQARDRQFGVSTAAIVIMIATTVSFVRVLIALAVMGQGGGELLGAALGPLLILMGLTLVPSLALWLRVWREPLQMPAQKNPTNLKSAIVFGLMYSAVLLALAAAKEHKAVVGQHGLMAVAALSGLTDMDAITLSTARMSLAHEIAAHVGWQLIVVGAMANLVSKAILGGLLGGWRLLGGLTALFLIPFLGGVALLLWW